MRPYPYPFPLLHVLSGDDPRVQLLANQEMLCAQVSQLEDDSSPESAGPRSYGGYPAAELRDLLSGQEADVRAQSPNCLWSFVADEMIATTHSGSNNCPCLPR